MRVARFNEAGEGRSGRLRQAFRGLVHARMLWAVGTVSLMGILGGFIFFSNRHTLPLQNQPPSTLPLSTAAAATEPAPAVEPAQTVVTVTPPASASTAVLPATSCDTAAHTSAENAREAALAKEQTRYEAIQRKGRGIKQLFSSVTGTVVTPPTAEETAKHTRKLAQIEAAYQADLRAADCML